MIIIRRNGVSDGARTLANALREAGEAVTLSDRTSFRRRNLTINWGATTEISRPVLNTPEAIETARDKLATFHAMCEAGLDDYVPMFWNIKPTEDERGNMIILERHTVCGSGGDGIVIRRKGEALADAPLYVEYIKKSREYRVHVFNGRAIAVQEKRRESDTEQSKDQKLIRNRANGWVFCVNDVSPPQGMADIAVAACEALQLDFGAVDMIVSKEGKVYVLEVNTKPGLESPTVVAAYVNAIKEYKNDSTSQPVRSDAIVADVPCCDTAN